VSAFLIRRQRDAERKRRVLRGRARLGGHHRAVPVSPSSAESCSRKVAIGDRAAGVSRAPRSAARSVSLAADGPTSLHG